jgi:hypothetical protein
MNQTEWKILIELMENSLKAENKVITTRMSLFLTHWIVYAIGLISGFCIGKFF